MSSLHGRRRTCSRHLQRSRCPVWPRPSEFLVGRPSSMWAGMGWEVAWAWLESAQGLLVRQCCQMLQGSPAGACRGTVVDIAVWHSAGLAVNPAKVAIADAPASDAIRTKWSWQGSLCSPEDARPMTRSACSYDCNVELCHLGGGPLFHGRNHDWHIANVVASLNVHVVAPTPWCVRHFHAQEMHMPCRVRTPDVMPVSKPCRGNVDFQRRLQRRHPVPSIFRGHANPRSMRLDSI
jgi:hypothetical protein